MKESKHIAVNQTFWDNWADTIDGKGFRNKYLRNCQRSVISMLELKEEMNILDIARAGGASKEMLSYISDWIETTNAVFE